MTTIAINGFGRMGRLALRAGFDNPELDFVQINEPNGDAATSAHLLAFDSVHGRWRDDKITSYEDQAIYIDGHEIFHSRADSPSGIDLGNIDIVLECSGAFRTPESLQPYFDAGVKKVIVAAPVKQGALNIVMGVNHHLYEPDSHHLLTAASCTTNCLAPAVKVVLENFGIRHGSITTIHDITNTQALVDRPHKDLRRARAAGQSLIPTSTGSATAIALIYPELAGKLDGHAVRVPLLNASLTDCVFELEKPTSPDEVNAAFERAASGELAGILGIEHRPLVSVDFCDDPRSCIVDALSTMVVDGTQLKLYLWYDNEIGYANRMIELAQMVARSLH